jgi:hypothetical protein
MIFISSFMFATSSNDLFKLRLEDGCAKPARFSFHHGTPSEKSEIIEHYPGTIHSAYPRDDSHTNGCPDPP